ncbi:MAG: VOC family protein [Deltaproteobacteria bacterium]|nr:VOC family protein [Deltaproteobacteria bacterium]
MQLGHVGLAICHLSEVAFFRDVLGMHIQYEFDILAGQNRQIFFNAAGNVNHEDDIPDVHVVMMKKNDVMLELFVLPKETPASLSRYGHLCFAMDDRQAVVEKATHLGYRIERFLRPSHPDNDLVFIFDKTGNRFELKQTGS